MIKAIYPDLNEIKEKEVLQWILVAFLKESLEFLSDKKNLKTRRIDWVRKWMEENTCLSGEYTGDIIPMNDLKKEIEIWKKLES